MRVENFEIVAPSTGEITPLDEWNSTSVQISMQHDHFVITDGEKKFSIVANQIFKTSEGIFFIRDNSQFFHLIHPGPFLSKLKFPKARNEGIVDWLKHCAESFQTFKRHELRTLIVSFLKAFRYAAVSVLLLYLVFKNFNLSSTAMAPVGKSGVLESALIYTSLKENLKNIRDEVFPPRTVSRERQNTPSPEIRFFRSSQKQNNNCLRGRDIDADVAKFLPAAKRGRCENL